MSPGFCILRTRASTNAAEISLRENTVNDSFSDGILPGTDHCGPPEHAQAFACLRLCIRLRPSLPLPPGPTVRPPRRAARHVS